MKPRHVHPMGSPQMSHGGITTGFTHPNHGLIVFMKRDVGLSGKQRVPQLQGRKPHQPKSAIRRDYFGLWGTVGNACLTLGHPSQTHKGVRSP